MRLKHIAAVTLLLAIVLGITACGSSTSSYTVKELLETYRWECSSSSTVTVYLFPNGKWQRDGRSITEGYYTVSGRTIEIYDGEDECIEAVTIEKYHKYMMQAMDEDSWEVTLYNMDYIP